MPSPLFPHDWLYLGSASTKAKARRLDTVAERVDNDDYRILVQSMLACAHEVMF